MLVRRGDASDWSLSEHLAFSNEDELQSLVQAAFEPILHTYSDAPAVIAREVAMPDRGRIDVLAIDTAGLITVCECKLASNAGSRREVVGQVVEYAGWLSSLSLRDFRACVEARLRGDLLEAMAQRAGDDWDSTTWLEEIAHTLNSGEFRLLIAVDETSPTLKQTVRYLNQHSQPAVMAVELKRGRVGDIEILSPTFFGEEEFQRKAPSPPIGPAVENPDTVIVAATAALPEYEQIGAYICQPHRSFRPGIQYLGFYAHREIAPMFPRVLAFRPGVTFASETVEELRNSGDSLDAKLADTLEKALSIPNAPRKIGEEYQVVLLDEGIGFKLQRPIRHEHGGAWTQGQRYTRSDALQTAPETTEALSAAGG